jgi:hypothetical protein
METEAEANAVNLDPRDVDQLRELLDTMAKFSSNDQRARFLLTSNWIRERGAAAQANAAAMHADIVAAWCEDSDLAAARAKLAQNAAEAE